MKPAIVCAAALGVWLFAAAAVWAADAEAAAADDGHPAAADHPADAEHPAEGAAHPTDGAAHPAGGGDINPLPIDPDLAIFTAIVFVVLMAVLYKFAWGPISEGLDKREKSIHDALEQARLGAEKAQAALADYEAKLAAAAAEAREIVAEGRRDAEVTRERVVAEAQAAASRERERALEEIEAAKHKALEELARHSVNQAFDLAARVIRREIKPGEHADLIQSALERLPSKN